MINQEEDGCLTMVSDNKEGEAQPIKADRAAQE